MNDSRGYTRTGEALTRRQLTQEGLTKLASVPPGGGGGGAAPAAAAGGAAPAAEAEEKKEEEPEESDEDMGLGLFD